MIYTIEKDLNITFRIEINDIISNLSLNGMDQLQILPQTRNKPKLTVIYQVVPIICTYVMVAKYKIHEDPHVPALLYIKECDTAHELVLQNIRMDLHVILILAHN